MTGTDLLVPAATTALVAEASDVAHVEVGVLGPVQLHGPNGAVDVRQGLPRVLLASLVVRAGETVSTDVLIEQLWPERPPANPANALQVQVSYLRRRLREAGDGIRIDRFGPGYRLVFVDGDVDARRFERTVDAVGVALPQPESATAARALLVELENALATWRGTPFADATYLSFAEADITRLEELRLVALEQRADLLDRLGRHGEAVAELQALTGEHGFREGLWVRLATSLYRAGRQADALRACTTARQRLADELGLDPGPELRTLEQRILEQDPALAWSPLPGDAEPTTVAPDGRERAEPTSRRVPIPASISPLIGRRWEVDAVGELLQTERLVTLVGPGGVGKTRIAYEAARRVPDAVVIELGAVHGPGQVASVVAAAAGVPTRPGRDPLDAVADRIGDDAWLLLLDTCEHVVDEVADGASRLLRSCPALRVLATSRQPLGVRGERTWPVPVLELPDPAANRATDVQAAAAARLFVERARAANPRFELDDSNAAAVAAICRALDGLPLAIELAAARTSALSPGAVLDRLEDRFSLLSRGGRDAERRQQSLRATLEWSIDLLDEDERGFLAMLGVFAGAFDLRAVEAVVGGGTSDVVDALAALVDRSLLVALGDDRYTLLDTVRAYTTELLDAAGPDATADLHRRHAAWYAGVAAACDPYGHGPLPQGWPRLRADAANLRAAVRWSFGPDGDAAVGASLVGSLAGSLVLDGAFAEADEWLELAMAAPASDADATKVFRGAAIVALYQGRFSDSLAAARASHARASASGEPMLVASSSLTVGSALWGLGDLDASADILRDAVERFDVAGDLRGRGFALARLARTLTAAGDPSAVEVATAAVDDLEASSDDWMRVPALDHLAAALWAAGDLDAAAERATEAVAAAERLGSYSGGLSALELLGRIRLAAGDPAGAEAAQVRAVDRASRVANAGVTADALEGIAEARAATGDLATTAWLLACAGAVRAVAGVAASDAKAARLDALADRAMAVLGDEAYARATHTGRRLAPAAALDRLRQASEVMKARTAAVAARPPTWR